MWYYRLNSGAKPVKCYFCKPENGRYFIGYMGIHKMMADESDLFANEAEAYEAYKPILLARREKLEAEIREIDDEINRSIVPS